MIRLSDQDLKLFHSGDAEAFRRIVEALSPRLLAYVRPFAGDVDEAKDILQETWRRVFEKREQYRGDGTLIGWCLAVCRTVCYAARSRSARSTVSLASIGDVATGGANPEGGAQQNELRRHILEALMDLPARERDVVILRMLEERSTRETATVLGCAEGTVKAALHHALKKLEARMEVWAL